MKAKTIPQNDEARGVVVTTMNQKHKKKESRESGKEKEIELAKDHKTRRQQDYSRQTIVAPKVLKKVK